MAIDYAALKSWRFADVIHRYEAKDTILYALGVGCGPEDLRFVYEQQLEALPSMAAVLGHPGFWLKDPATGIDWRQALHGEEAITLHALLPAAATVIGRARVDEIVDKGSKGALLLCSREIVEETSGRLIATVASTVVLRGHGGFGGPSGPAPARPAAPRRTPEAVCTLPTLPQAALLYRLSGDANPLHVDPDIAKAAGFPRPILHGLCTLGVATRAILKRCCGNEPARLTQIRARFSAPVFPGETIAIEIWQDGTRIDFRARAVERTALVLEGGHAVIAA